MSHSQASSELSSPDSGGKSLSSESPSMSIEVSTSPTISQQSLTQEGKARSSRAQNATSDSSKASTPQFDPKVLLSPRAVAKRSRNALEDEDSTTQADDTSTSATSSGMSSLIERMHNVSRRGDEPRKRIKKEAQADDEDPAKKSSFTGTGKGTVLGQYMKDKREEGRLQEEDSGPPTNLPLVRNNDVVDLTGGDDDDELVLVSDTGEREVCLGRIDKAFVNAYQVPYLKPGGFQGIAKKWPAFKVTFKRRAVGNDLRIGVWDPTGKEFGTLDVRTASGLAPLMSGVSVNRMRLHARLKERDRDPLQKPGQGISEPLWLILQVYAPRKYAISIAKFLSQKQVFLREPVIPERGIEYWNPQAPKAMPGTVLTTRSGINPYSPGNSYVMRTVEEVRTEVISMFDSLKQSEELPEKEQPSGILTPLLAHQKQALWFMTDREQDRSVKQDDKDESSLWRIRFRPNGRRVYYNVITGLESPQKPPPVYGGILADMMGLGKTLSILSLIVDSLDQAKEWSTKKPAQSPGTVLLRNSQATLLVAPVSTVANWEDQIRTHVEPKKLSYYIYHGPNRTQDVEKLAEYNVIITTYSIIATEWSKSKKSPLEQTNFFRIVLDEAHMIREQATRASQAICALSAQRRWAVTGTPVQNRIDDLGALIKFLRIEPFSSKSGFANFILSPLKNADPEVIPKLRLLVDSITLRRLKDRIDLPPRHDQIVKLEFSADERKLYDLFAMDIAKQVNAMTGGREKLGGKVYVHILRSIMRLRLICAHGQELLSDEDMKITEGISADKAIDLGDEEDDEKCVLSAKQVYDMVELLRTTDMDRCSMCNKKVAEENEDTFADANVDKTLGYMTPCYQIICTGCMEAFQKMVEQGITPDKYMKCPLCDSYVKMIPYRMTRDELQEAEEARAKLRNNPRLAKQIGRYQGPHTKTKALLDALNESYVWSEAHPDEPPIKSVIFSGWTSHLDLIQIALDDNNLPYTRLDGRMSRTQRRAALDKFRDDKDVPIILVSIGAGGLGLNLTTASKVYVMEPQFNPAAEAQAVDRVHRLGQKREVTITRFIMEDSFEEKMLELQQKKVQLADLSMNRNVKLDKAEAAKKRLEDLKSLFK